MKKLHYNPQPTFPQKNNNNKERKKDWPHAAPAQEQPATYNI